MFCKKSWSQLTIYVLLLQLKIENEGFQYPVFFQWSFISDDVRIEIQSNIFFFAVSIEGGLDIFSAISPVG